MHKTDGFSHGTAPLCIHTALGLNTSITHLSWRELAGWDQSGAWEWTKNYTDNQKFQYSNESSSPLFLSSKGKDNDLLSSKDLLFDS